MSNDRYRGDTPDLLNKVKELEKRISALERSPQLPSSGINSGGITISGGALTVIRGFAEGALDVGSSVVLNGQEGMAMTVQRSQSVEGGYTTVGGEPINGCNSMIIGTVEGEDPDFKFPSFSLYDKSNNELVSDSTNGRMGFSEPRMHYSFVSGAFTSSTSTTFADIMTCEWYMYHPNLRIRVLVQNDGGNSSELRVSENGGSPELLLHSVAAGAFVYADLVLARSTMAFGQSPNGNQAEIHLEHRRVAGAGTIRTKVISCVGIDLSWFEDF